MKHGDEEFEGLIENDNLLLETFPPMAHEQWRRVRAEIARFARERVRAGNNRAQTMVFDAYRAGQKAKETSDV